MDTDVAGLAGLGLGDVANSEEQPKNMSIGISGSDPMEVPS